MSTRSIVLSGFMATGKTTIGRRLAERLGLPFADTDAELESKFQSPVHVLWKTWGEGEFRRREAEIATSLLSHSTRRVIAFGGGTATVREVRHLALDRGILVTLTAPADVIVARSGDLSQRPNLSVGEPVQRARELMDQRAAVYAECHVALSTHGTDVDAVCTAIEEVAARDPLVMPLGARTYRIELVYDDPQRLTQVVSSFHPSKLVIVSDANVMRGREAALRRSLDSLATPFIEVGLPAGEAHKNFATVGTIWDAALGAGIDRDAVVIAFGGGVVGDLAGFAASTLLRGVRVVQVPTTVLAMVDASVGGKTGFDHPVGKNLVGTFHQPSAVVVDRAHLRTLPIRERVAGLAEVAKIALATDAPLLADLTERAHHLERDADLGLGAILRAAIAAKIRVVRDDERELGARALLNFGHTVGHALEVFGQYHRHLHGEAVALGMMVELAATERLGWTPPDLAKRFGALLKVLGLPTHVPDDELRGAWKFVASDKKRSADGVRLPVVTAAGVSEVRQVPLRDLERVFFG